MLPTSDSNITAANVSKVSSMTVNAAIGGGSQSKSNRLSLGSVSQVQKGRLTVGVNNIASGGRKPSPMSVNSNYLNPSKINNQMPHVSFFEIIGTFQILNI